MWTIPNVLTLFRLALLPVIIALFYIHEPWAAWTCLGLYITGALTDWLDGLIARKFNQVSEFGTFMDPISDKIYVTVILLMLVSIGQIYGPWLIPVIVIIIREFVVSGLREYLGPKNIQMPVTKLAKWKTAIQMASLSFLIVGPYAPYALEIGLWSLTFAALLTGITGWGYLKAGLEHMSKSA